MKFVIVIPARYASTRFPGKPLAKIEGKPMIQLTYEQATKVSDRVVVATDDQRIFDTVVSFGGKVLMTRSDHKSGTDRCYEAWQKLKKKGEIADVLINLQGDEPFINPKQIEQLMSVFTHPNIDIATLGKKIEKTETLFDPNVVKLIKTEDGKAIYFSRFAIPFLRNTQKENWIHHHHFFKHIGLYAYRTETLEKIAHLSQSPLEKCESLEQLRWLENDFHIQVVETKYESIGIDCPQDLEEII